MIRTLKFKDPTFILNAVNMTIRRGVKWALEGYAYIETENTKTEKYEKGSPERFYDVIETSVKRFCDIELKEIVLWHLYEKRLAGKVTKDYLMREHLYLEMQHRYFNFSETEIVTLVYFHM